MKCWWDLLLEPQYGCFSNGTKPWLVVKEGAVDTARKVFNGSDIHIINLLLTAANANRVVLSI